MLVAEVDLPRSADLPALEARISEVAAELDVEVSLRPVERDEL